MARSIAIGWMLLLGGCGMLRVEICSERPQASVFLVRKVEWEKNKSSWRPEDLHKFRVKGEFAKAGDCKPGYVANYAYFVVTQCGAGAPLAEAMEIRPALDEKRTYQVCQ